MEQSASFPNAVGVPLLQFSRWSKVINMDLFKLSALIMRRVFSLTSCLFCILEILIDSIRRTWGQLGDLFHGKFDFVTWGLVKQFLSQVVAEFKHLVMKLLGLIKNVGARMALHHDWGMSEII